LKKINNKKYTRNSVNFVKMYKTANKIKQNYSINVQLNNSKSFH